MIARTALVTGANRGLGLETARQLGARGFRVILTSRNEPEGYAAAHELVAEGLAVEHRLLDVASRASIDGLVDGLTRDGARLGVLVNNAGIAPKGFSADILKKTLDVNFYGAERVTDALLPFIDDGGCVLMVSSSLGELSGGYSPAIRKRLLEPDLPRAELHELLNALVRAVEHSRQADTGWPSSAYRISKAALNALTRIFARELAGRRVRVNAVCPGWVRTDMGTANATRSVEEGAASIVWAASLDDGPTGGFYRDGQPLPW